MSKPRRRRKPPNPKRTGEHSEVAFLYRANQRRFAISKPFGDSERYDFILDNRPIPEAAPASESSSSSAFRSNARRGSELVAHCTAVFGCYAGCPISRVLCEKWEKPPLS